MSHFKLVYREFPEALKGKIPGFTAKGRDGKLAIMIDEDLPEAEKNLVLRHELSHIALGHLDDDRTKNNHSYLANLAELEDEADQYADRMTDEEFTNLMKYAV